MRITMVHYFNSARRLTVTVLQCFTTTIYRILRERSVRRHPTGILQLPPWRRPCRNSTPELEAWNREFSSNSSADFTIQHRKEITSSIRKFYMCQWRLRAVTCVILPPLRIKMTRMYYQRCLTEVPGNCSEIKRENQSEIPITRIPLRQVQLHHDFPRYTCPFPKSVTVAKQMAFPLCIEMWNF